MGPAVLLVQRILPPFNRVVGKIFGLGEDESRSVQDYSFDAIPVLRASWRDVRSLSVCTVAWYGNWWVRFMESMEFRAAWRFVKILTPQKKGYEANSGFYKVVWERKGRKSPKRRFCDLSDHLKPLQVYEPHHNKILKYCIYDNTRALISGVFLLLSSSLLFTIMIMAAASQSDHMRRTWQICWPIIHEGFWYRMGLEGSQIVFFSVSKFTSVWTPGE